jgi:hypothetical protein
LFKIINNGIYIDNNKNIEKANKTVENIINIKKQISQNPMNKFLPAKFIMRNK